MKVTLASEKDIEDLFRCLLALAFATTFRFFLFPAVFVSYCRFICAAFVELCYLWPRATHFSTRI